SAFFSASSKRLMSAGFALRVRPAEDVVVGQHATQLAVVAVDACVAHYRGAQEDHQLGLLAEFALVLEYAAKDWNVAQAGHGVLLAFGRFLDQPAEHGDLAAGDVEDRLEFARLEFRDRARDVVFT